MSHQFPSAWSDLNQLLPFHSFHKPTNSQITTGKLEVYNRNNLTVFSTLLKYQNRS